ncbi:MAG TPA: hypothetical protein PLW14_12525, partial [Chlorobiota bacterium]|nr:hypothetical protein [Chlorobiota bacterium]
MSELSIRAKYKSSVINIVFTSVTPRQPASPRVSQRHPASASVSQRQPASPRVSQRRPASASVGQRQPASA